MKKLMTLTGVTAAALLWGTGPSYAVNSPTTAAAVSPAPAKSSAHKVKTTTAAAPTSGPAQSYYAAPPQLVPGINYGIGNYGYSPALTKFVDTLPGMTAPLNAASAKNNLQQYIPLAVPMGVNTPAGVPLDGDYYEIAIVDYTEQMHTDMPLGTKLRGYVQIEPPGAAQPPESLHVQLFYADGTTPITVSGQNVYGYDKPHYLGPVIEATRGTPTRVKFYNLLATTANGGDLFIPTDTTLMGGGQGPLGPSAGDYTQNRAVIHLHGGDTPWISDGTPHQWITPAGETTSYAKGASEQFVPDMGLPPLGATTLYYPNGQSGRLLFYHEHAQAITRLGVYAGVAAGYLVVDPTERALNSFAPGGEIPLVIQDKSFVNDGTLPATWPTGAIAPPTTLASDPSWALDSRWGQTKGSLWFPHVYIPNQNPNDLSGANPFGRWDYGQWFWPVFPVVGPLPQTADGLQPLPSVVPEAFMDTPIVNGTAYPTLTVQPTTYRFRILSVANERYFNLQFYVANPGVVNAISGGLGGLNYSAPLVTISGGGGTGATAEAIVDPATGAITAINMISVGSGYTTAPTVTITDPTGTGAAAATASVWTAPTEVGMLPAVKSSGVAWPTWWRANDTPGMIPNILDGRQGGVPDPAYIGPSFVHIGTDGGLAPQATVLKNTPIGYEQNKRSVTVLNTLEHTLFLGPAERADVLVDFSGFAGKTLILYNDSPAPVPAGDPRYDLYTGDLDNTVQGGAPTTLAGFGPNTRTIMQINVASGSGTALDVAALSTAVSAAFAATQPMPVVPESGYNAAEGAPPSGTDVYGKISDTSLGFTPYVGAPESIGGPITVPLQPKTIQELFDPLGRMNATLGVEIPFTTATVQTTLPMGFEDPGTEIIPDGSYQLWKITHNGVDTHAMHFHLWNVQVINRVGWDGAIKPPWPEELGWKDTLKMNPLEDVIIALRAKIPTVPFTLPNSIRPLSPSNPIGAISNYYGAPIFLGVDPNGNPVTVTNKMANFGNEYVWHCHLLGHEENDMMRPVCVASAPAASTLTAALTGSKKNTSAVLTWTASPNATSYTLQRASDTAFTLNLVTVQLGNVLTYSDPIGNTSAPFYYRVIAVNTVGSGVAGYPSVSANSPFSNTAGVNTPQPPVAPSNLTATILSATSVRLNWTDNANNETGFQVWKNGTLLTTLGANTTTYTDGGVSLNGTYTYQVRAVNSVGLSAFAGPISVTIAVPAAPSGLTAIAVRAGTRDNVTLSWTDNSNNESSFVIQRATNPGFTTGVNNSTVAANTTTLTQTGLTRVASYYYQIRAVNAVGTSAWVTATPLPVVTP